MTEVNPQTISNQRAGIPISRVQSFLLDKSEVCERTPFSPTESKSQVKAQIDADLESEVVDY